MKAHFLKPGDNRESIERIRYIFLSDSTLYIAVAYFNYLPFTELIKNRILREQTTCLLINTSDILRPKEIGDTEIVISQALMLLLNFKSNYLQIKCLGLRAKGKYKNMHHKFICSNRTLIFGSVNFTDAAFNRNYESFIETNDNYLIKEYRAEFIKMWEISSFIYTGTNGTIRSLMCPHCEVSEGVDFESYGVECGFCGYKFKVN